MLFLIPTVTITSVETKNRQRNPKMSICLTKVKTWLPLIILLALTGIWWLFGLGHLISFETIKAQRNDLLNLAGAHPFASPAIFMFLYFCVVALSLPFATPLTLLGGFLFGVWWGTMIVVLAATSGAAILFLIARSSLGRSLKERANPLYDKIADQMNKNAIGYMLFMRLLPLFPFFLVNIVPALFNIRFLPYILTTLFGIIPATFVYVNVGQKLGSLNSLNDLVSRETLLIFSVLGIFALMPSLYKRFKGTK